MLGRTHGIEEISREDNLRTPPLPPRARANDHDLQASSVKIGLDAATEARDWGVNDLDGTSWRNRSAAWPGSYHGVKLEPADLIGAAHAAGRPAAERDTLTGFGAGSRSVAA